MAIISRFIKYTVPKLARHKFLIYDSPLHCRVSRPYDRQLSSKVFEDDDNEVLTNADPELFGTKSKSTESNYNFSSEISSKKSSKILPFRRLKEHEKYKYFASYTLAKKLGEVESPEDFVSRGKSNSNDDLLTVPVACIYFNNCQFPNEKSILNWIRAIDFGLKQRCITSFGLSIAIRSLFRLLRDYPHRPDKLLSAVGCDRLTTWFEYALQENCGPLTHNKSIRNCIEAAGCFAKYTAFMKWKPSSLYGRLNYSLSIYIPAQLKCQECVEDDAVFNEILRPIITVEIDLDQPCSLEQATMDEVVNIAIKYFRFYAQLMEKPESLSIQDKRAISVSHGFIARLFCHWRVNDSRFWTDWFEFSMNRMFKINEDPRVLSKQLQSMLLTLLQSNADPNFVCNDADFAKYLVEKVKPVFNENLRANGLRFVTKSESIMLMKLLKNCLRASESPLFTNEELRDIIDNLDQERYNRDREW